MPLPRKSCDACFIGRRKCDLGSPACGRCLRGGKDCHYSSSASPITSDSQDSASIAVSDDSWMVTEFTESHAQSQPQFSPRGDNENGITVSFDLAGGTLLSELITPSVPSFVGPLGELQSLDGSSQSWNWVMRQLKALPQTFVQQTDTIFIHGNLYRDSLPKAIRAALGVCAAHACVNERNRAMVYRALDEEASELLKSQPSETLLEDLSKIQALVMFHIIRLFHGDLKERLVAEQQCSLFETRILQLLRRSESEHRAGGATATWDAWVVAESTRRTALVAYLVSAIYTIFKHGICKEIPTLSILPLSTKFEFWTSQSAFAQQFTGDETMTYTDFTAMWLATPPRKLDPFEKLLLVACKGIEPVQAHSLPDDATWIWL
ncbi:hypothetical protein BX600DRAFT_519130 [Xylariales sp. PMI_506]|nr:hypothetical protein BX600DRAFT_519130 [Xylariales sp. PMI_506]